MESLLNAKQVAGLLGVSVRSVYRLRDGLRMPRPVRVGTLLRWREGELRQWLDAGCPRTQPQMTEAVRAALQARKGGA
jgi:predicted DNA-binding transcriptional regulator AlpA